jgi:hypothetical protein
MKLVKQRYEWDCGIAAMACHRELHYGMVLGEYLLNEPIHGMSCLQRNKGTISLTQMTELAEALDRELEVNGPGLYVGTKVKSDLEHLGDHFENGAEGIAMIGACKWGGEYDPARHYVAFRKDKGGRLWIADPLDVQLRLASKSPVGGYAVRGLLGYYYDR